MPSDVKVPGPCPDLKPTIGFICPLYRELAAVRAIFDEDYGSRQTYTDNDVESEYHYGRIGPSVAVAVSFVDGKVGPVRAADCATRLLDRHKSLHLEASSCFLVGVAAGISRKHDVRLGDVVIALQVVDWTSGKVNSGNAFESTEYPQDVSKIIGLRTAQFCDDLSRLSDRIRDRVDKMRSQDAANRIPWGYPGAEQDVLFQPEVEHAKEGKDCIHCGGQTQQRDPPDICPPRVHRGLIAAGNRVLKDAGTREKIRQDFNDKVLAVEMEAHGVMTASKKFVIIRGVCDYGDSHKNERWQHHAAAVAAACARLWIEDFVLADAGAPGDEPPTKALGFSEQHADEKAPCPPYQPRTMGEKRQGEPGAISSMCRTEGESGEWITRLDVKVSCAELFIRKGPVGEQPILTKLKESKLVFEVRNDQDACGVTRRLRLTNVDNHLETSCFLWIPHSQIQVSRKEKAVTVDFSNCNQCAKCRHGNFDTRNGTVLYRTIYDAESPNVGLDLQLANNSDAFNLCKLLTSPLEHLVDLDGGVEQDFGHCHVAYNPVIKDAQFTNITHVWAREGEHETFDLGSFSDKLDFDVVLVDGIAKVCFGYMDKFVYMPVDDSAYPSSSDPPVRIKENYDGRPGSVSYGGGHLPSSCLYMKVGGDSICDLLSLTVGSFVGWQMKAFVSEVAVVLVSNSFLRKSQSFSSVQLSAWRAKSNLRLLARVSGDGTHESCWWIACEATCSSKLHIKSDCDVTIYHDALRQGDHISSATFLPSSDAADTSSSRRGSSREWDSFKLKFRCASDRTQFERLFENESDHKVNAK